MLSLVWSPVFITFHTTVYSPNANLLKIDYLNCYPIYETRMIHKRCSDLHDVLRSAKDARPHLARHTDGVLGVVRSLLVCLGVRAHQIPVNDRPVNAMAHL